MRPKISPLVAPYLTALEVERRASPHTLSAYARDLAKLEDYAQDAGIDPLNRLNPHNARLFAAHCHRSGLSPKSIQRVLSACRGLFDHWLKTGEVQNNPFTDIRAPKAAKRLPKTLNIDQVNALVETQAQDPLAVRDQAIMELFYSSGLRLSELSTLNLADLDMGERMVRVLGKGRKVRELPVGRKAHAALTAWFNVRAGLPVKDAEAVFLSQRGTRLAPRSIQQRIKHWARIKGIEVGVSPHMLRHSFASHMLESSGELRSVQELLGHANISTTQIYTHLDFQHLAEVYDTAHPRAKMKGDKGDD